MARKWYAGRRVRGLKTDSKPSSPEIDTEFEETDTGNKYKFNGSDWIFFGDGKMASGDTKPTNALSGSTILETDTLVTYDYDGSAWVARASGGGTISGGTMSFPHSTTDDDYTKTGTITFSSFESNGQAGALHTDNGNYIGYWNAPYRTSSWTGYKDYSLGDKYLVEFTPNWNVGSSLGSGYPDPTVYYTDGTSETRTKGQQYAPNKQVNKVRYYRSGGYYNSYPQINFYSTSTWREGNTESDINNEQEVGTTNEINPWIQNDCGNNNLFGADINDGSLGRTTCTQYKVEVWNGSAWVRVRTLGNTLGKMRWNGIYGSKIRITGLDSGAKRLSIDKFRIYKKVDSDLFDHGHTEIDPNETLGLDGS